jgi:putative PIG3 family NAD(P)H quinone oxidoreductase
MIEERASRALERHEVRVEVAAVGLNRADTLQRRGFYPAPPGVMPDVPGLEYAGRIVEAGEGVPRTRVGERVMGLVPGGAMASEICVADGETLPVPPNLTLEEAAAVPEVFITVWDAVKKQAAIASGQTLVVHAIGSGIGTAAIALARAWGVKLIGTSRSAAKLARAGELGLEHGLVVGDPPTFARQIGELTDGAMADVILDTVGGSYLDENVRALATRGTIVVIGLVGGASGTLPLGVLLAKRGRIIGTVMRTRTPEEKRAIAAGFTRELFPLFVNGTLRPVIDDILPMADVRRAHARMDADETFGKLVLTW